MINTQGWLFQIPWSLIVFVKFRNGLENNYVQVAWLCTFLAERHQHTYFMVKSRLAQLKRDSTLTGWQRAQSCKFWSSFYSRILAVCHLIRCPIMLLTKRNGQLPGLKHTRRHATQNLKLLYQATYQLCTMWQGYTGLHLWNSNT